MSDDLAALEARVRETRIAFHEASDQLLAARLAATGFEIGEVVEALVGEDWTPAIIRDISPWPEGGAGFKVSLARRSDGYWSRQARYTYQVRKAVAE